jgi:hypothetical protein
MTAETKQKMPPLVQFFEKVHDRVYTIERKGLIFSHTDVVRTDRISNELTLEITTPEPPHKIILNGKELFL